MKKNQTFQTFEDLIFMSCGDGLINFELKMHFGTLEKQDSWQEREASLHSGSEQDELFVRTRQRMRIESFDEEKEQSKLTLDTPNFSALTKKSTHAKNFETDAEEDSVYQILQGQDLHKKDVEMIEFEQNKEQNQETKILDIPDPVVTPQVNQYVLRINFAQSNTKVKKIHKKINKKPVNLSKVKIDNKVSKVKLFWKKQTKQIPSVFYLTKKLAKNQFKEWQCYSKKEVLITQDSQPSAKIEFSSIQKKCTENNQSPQDVDFSFENNFD